MENKIKYSEKNIEDMIIEGSCDGNIIKYILLNDINIKFAKYRTKEKFYDLISNYKITDDIKYYLCYVVKYKIDVFNQSIEIRKKLGSIVFDNINELYFNDTNNFKGFIFDDDAFRKIFKNIVFKKRLNENFLMRNYQYELNKENWINNEINYDVCSNGLYFCQKYNIMKYRDYGNIEVIITIPKSYKSYWLAIEDDKIKSECLFLQSKGIIINTKD